MSQRKNTELFSLGEERAMPKSPWRASDGGAQPRAPKSVPSEPKSINEGEIIWGRKNVVRPQILKISEAILEEGGTGEKFKRIIHKALLT